MIQVVLLLLFQFHVNLAELEVKVCGSLPKGHRHGAAVYDGLDNIYFLGGAYILGSFPNVPLDTVVRYNVNTQESEIVGRFPNGVYTGAAAIDGKGDIFYFGGFNKEHQSSIYKLNHQNLTPVVVNHLATPTNSMSAVSIGSNSIFLFGGYQSVSGYRDEIQHYNSSTNTLELVGRLPEKMYDVSSVYDGKHVYIFGGNHYDGIKNIYKFDPIQLTIETLDTISGASTASYMGGDQTILVSAQWLSATQFHFFHHGSGTLEELKVNFTQGVVNGPVAAYVSKNKKLYMHGIELLPSSTLSDDVYCIDFSEN